MERVVDDPLLTERVALERLLVAGATLLTEEVLPDCVDTLRVELLPATLRLVDEPATLRLEVEASPTDLDAIPDEAGVTVRLALVPNEAVRLVVLRLRLRSHPPLLILRLGV